MRRIAPPGGFLVIKRRDLGRIAVAGGVLIGTAVAAPLAQAETCFSGFGGTVKYNFAPGPATFTTPGTYSVPGVTFGALSPCAGLKKWPIVGTVTVTTTSVVLAFRALTVSAASCGAVDNIVAMTPRKLSGLLQLHNDRTKGSNSTTFSQTACVAPPPDEPYPNVSTQRGLDPQGN
jgi:hypothetical protein